MCNLANASADITSHYSDSDYYNDDYLSKLFMGEDFSDEELTANTDPKVYVGAQ